MNEVVSLILDRLVPGELWEHLERFVFSNDGTFQIPQEQHRAVQLQSINILANLDFLTCINWYVGVAETSFEHNTDTRLST